MKLIVCIDKDRGMAFNRRRQSRDSAVIADLAAMLQGTVLHIAPYSAPLFQDSGINISVSDDPLAACGPEEYCFLEDRSPAEYADTLTQVILYHWNRRYPGDLKLELDLAAYKRARKENFPGTSHDKITKEIWTK